MAYRGDSSRYGWTTEADLLEGCRTTLADIMVLLAQEDSLILLAKANGALLGTVLLLHQGRQVEMSMFAVSPRHQGRGIGKQLLHHAEQTAIQRWGVKQSIMAVISSRQELIAFYQRRGYLLTGESKPFPVNPALWTAKINDLSLSILAKAFCH